MCRLTWVDTLPQCFNSTTQSESRLSMTLRKKAFGNIVGKGENAAFSPFPTMFFYPIKDINHHLSYI